MVVIKSEKIVYGKEECSLEKDEVRLVELHKDEQLERPFWVQIADHEGILCEDNSNGFNYYKEFKTIDEAQRYYDKEVEYFKKELQRIINERNRIKDPNNALSRLIREKKRLMKEQEVYNMVNVYEDGEIVAVVDYNNNLDTWDGSNWSCGSTGRHEGITELEDGRLVLINGTDWQGQEDSANIITKDEAIQKILRSGNLELLDTFGLKEDANKVLIKEKKVEF